MMRSQDMSTGTRFAGRRYGRVASARGTHPLIAMPSAAAPPTSRKARRFIWPLNEPSPGIERSTEVRRFIRVLTSVGGWSRGDSRDDLPRCRLPELLFARRAELVPLTPFREL